MPFLETTSSLATYMPFIILALIFLIAMPTETSVYEDPHDVITRINVRFIAFFTLIGLSFLLLCYNLLTRPIDTDPPVDHYRVTLVNKKSELNAVYLRFDNKNSKTKPSYEVEDITMQLHSFNDTEFTLTRLNNQYVYTITKNDYPKLYRQVQDYLSQHQITLTQP